MKNHHLFLDSDVIISAIISQKGAAYWLLATQNQEFHISDYSYLELQQVCDRMRLSRRKLAKLCANCQQFELQPLLDITDIKNTYQAYTTDINDCHIVAGAVASQANFLITYNLKHYKHRKLIEDFDIVTLTPALFLQYLRSQQSS